MLVAKVAKRRGGFALEAEFEVAAGESLAVIGESGAGKTTLLRLLAGLDMPDAGTIEIDGHPVYDQSRGIADPAWRRPIAVVTQDYVLFPHLTAFGNVAFGLRAAGVPNGAIRDRVHAALERAGAAELASRWPDTLSGGQRQRVALARALVLEPALLLLDEPLSAVDAGTRATLRGDLRRVLATQRCATVHVTHDPIDAITLGDRIAVLEAGHITQVGTRDELFRRPRSGYVATLLGINLLRGTMAREKDRQLVRTADGDIAVSGVDADGQVYAVVNPHDITLYRDAAGGSAQNLLRAIVTEVTPQPPRGERVRVALASRPPLVAEVTANAVAQMGITPGVELYAAFKATAVDVFA
ncbi:MAG: ABC transporter ATP-binding protein [Gemmatimonadales bacterium]